MSKEQSNKYYELGFKLGKANRKGYDPKYGYPDIELLYNGQIVGYFKGTPMKMYENFVEACEKYMVSVRDDKWNKI